MQFLFKISTTIAIIVFCTQIGKKFPSLGGLIATMPLTGLIVLVWLYSDNPGDYEIMVKYTKGALWGILPSILFFLVAFLCFKKHFSLAVVLPASFGIWLIGAFIHQWLLS
jgi:F0F1-type ATP synthase assembly protein I